VTADVWLGAPEAERCFDPEALSAADRKRYAELRGAKRRQEFAVSRALKDIVMRGSTAATSLSHSGGWAAVARGPQDCRLGVDIEFHRPRDVLRIARFAFDPSEIAGLEGLESAQLLPLFYALWTMKEAMAKALGVPLLVASRQCVFTSGPAGWRGTAPIDQQWQVQVFQPRPDMALSVVIVGDHALGPIATFEWPPTVAASWTHIATVRSDRNSP
jgi:4'-phosphopantetheinyl transferase